MRVLSFPLLLTVAYCFVLEDKAGDECDSGSFPCDDKRCVKKWDWCDTILDCEDGSDEKYCSKATHMNPDPNNCTAKQFKCWNGRCIPKKGLCDGEDSCGDRSDEISCGTSSPYLVSTSAAYSEKQFLTLAHEPELQDGSGDYHGDEKLGSTAVDKMSETTLQSLLVSDTSVTRPIDLPNELRDEDVGKHSKTVQPDHPKTSPTISSKPDIFIELKPGKYRIQVRSAIEWLLAIRDKDLSWGDDTSRALTALSLSDSSFVNKAKDAMLMIKQLHLQLAVALIRNDTKPIPLSDLALYTNALMATCSDPRNFHGIDLIAVLRHRTNSAQTTGKFISPLVYLTLCLGNSTSREDIATLQEMFYGKSPSMDKMDVQSLAALATLCMSRTPGWSDHPFLQESSRLFLQKVTSNGLPENIYELSLVVQALNEARVPENWWNRNKAMSMILDQTANGSFGDILSTYYALPILSGRSLASIGKSCRHRNAELTPLEVLKNTKETKIFIRYTLRFDDPIEVTRSLQLKVPRGTSFFDIMRLASDVDSNFEFKYSIVRGQPVIYSIGNKANDAEKGMYWVLLVASAADSNHYTNRTEYTGDIRQYYPVEADDSVFWLKTLS